MKLLVLVRLVIPLLEGEAAPKVAAGLHDGERADVDRVIREASAELERLHVRISRAHRELPGWNDDLFSGPLTSLEALALQLVDDDWTPPPPVWPFGPGPIRKPPPGRAS